MTDREKLIELLMDSPGLVALNDDWKRDADYLLANGVTVQQWIPVTERLPKDNQKVLIYSEKGAMLIMAYDHHWKTWRGFGNIHVTHWMPLPESPKDGGAENE